MTPIPVASDPPIETLRNARLTPASCTEDRAAVDERVAAMKAEIDTAFEQWRGAEPECRARLQEEAREARACATGRGPCYRDLTDAIGLAAGSAVNSPPNARAPVPARATRMSTTNNQVAAVDESDIVKTDGRYVYILSHGALRILEALKPRVVSVTKVPGVVREMTLEGDRVVVLTASGEGEPRCTYAYGCDVIGDGTSTTARVFDITDRATPKLVRTLAFSGSLLASRRVGTTVHVVVANGDNGIRAYESWPEDLDNCGPSERTVRTRLAALKIANEKRIRHDAAPPTLTDDGVDVPLCDAMMEAKSDPGHNVTTVVSFDMSNRSVAAKAASVRSRPGTVFAAEDALYISDWQREGRVGRQAYYPSSDEVSEIHKFRLGAHPSDTRYVGSGVVPGHVLNSFSMDEWHGDLRVATSRGRVPDPDVENVVSILAEDAAGDLVRIGAVDHLARGEDIRAVRFDDDRAYLVTFKKTDPLFVLDLHDVVRPSVLGELKIPGFSTYLHRLDATHLLSIGFDANDHGSFAYFDGLLLQIFDVTDPLTPKLLHREKIGSRGSSSAAVTDHLAFDYLPDRGLLALPMSICEKGGDGSYGAEKSFSGLVVYHVDEQRGFTPLGRIDHGVAGINCTTFWSEATSKVKRSLFLDDLVYSIADDRVKVQRLGAFGQDVANIALRP